MVTFLSKEEQPSLVFIQHRENKKKGIDQNPDG